MDEADVNLAELSRACGVSIQAVYDWRATGRIGKQHLVKIGQLTKKPLEYFLVGLGRAAVLAFVAVTLFMHPQQADAKGCFSLMHDTLSIMSNCILCRLLNFLNAVCARLHFPYSGNTVSYGRERLIGA
jgi:hypothetical protein